MGTDIAVNLVMINENRVTTMYALVLTGVKPSHALLNDSVRLLL